MRCVLEDCYIATCIIMVFIAICCLAIVCYTKDLLYNDDFICYHTCIQVNIYLPVMITVVIMMSVWLKEMATWGEWRHATVEMAIAHCGGLYVGRTQPHGVLVML